MRKQIAAANWKMNLTLQEGETLLDNIINQELSLNPERITVFGIPAPYLQMASKKVAGKENIFIAAQNVYSKKGGAYTGENSVTMLKCLNINWCIIADVTGNHLHILDHRYIRHPSITPGVRIGVEYYRWLPQI